MLTGRTNIRSLGAATAGKAALLAAGPVAVHLALFHGVATAAAVAAAGFAWLAWARPEAALLAVLGLVPALAALGHGAGPLPAAALGAVALLLPRAVLGAPRARLDLLLILLTAVALTLSWLLPAVPLHVEHTWKSYGLLLVGLGLLAAAVLTPPDPRRVARTVAGSGALLAALLLLRGAYADGRLTGLGLNPNYVGAALALPLVAAAGLIRTSRSWLWVPPGALCACALVETRSRGAFVMAAAGLACVLFLGRPLRHKALIVLALLTAAALLPGTLDSVEDDLTGSRSRTELTSNTAVREKAALLAVRVAVDHPLRGIGYALFPEYARNSPGLGVYMNTHNDYLRLAAEAGPVTLVLLLALLWLGLARRYPPDHAVLQAVCVAYAAGLLFANALTDLVISTPFWICLGCLLARAGRRGALPHRQGPEPPRQETPPHPHRRSPPLSTPPLLTRTPVHDVRKAE
ncbi:O-antigen ligase family protein [Streptomyces sp. NPDC048664]|uniref:O-antigen ligase family protein n=1 Tax=Streptomyces sp. NPDC048664 TaxID=3154505 RepID=UPI003419E6BC